MNIMKGRALRATATAAMLAVFGAPVWAPAALASGGAGMVIFLTPRGVARGWGRTLCGGQAVSCASSQ